jgi:Ser/Thr protein kinase RdoA (MazF antagonist)
MDQLKAIVEEQYGIQDAHVSLQQGGWAARAYKVTARDRTFFLKMYEKSRASTPKWTALIDAYVPIMMWLIEHSGLRGKMPVPVPTRQGEYKCEDGAGIYLLYAYIEGDTIGEQELTEKQVAQLAEIIAELHRYGENIPVDTQSIREDFAIPFLSRLRNVLGKGYDLIPGDAKSVITPHLEQLYALMDRVGGLSASLKNGRGRMALCHTDLHNWNLMQSGGQLILIDWEGLKLAPVEADLMFLVDKPYYPQFSGIYEKRHRSFAINPDALAFYQGRRKLEDIWEFLEQLVFDSQDQQERERTIQYLEEALKS